MLRLDFNKGFLVIRFELDGKLLLGEPGKSRSSHEPNSRIRVDQIRTEKIFQQTNWPQMELKTIDAPIIVSTRTGLLVGKYHV